MRAYFFLELDTRSPQIQIFAPDYTGRDYYPIRIEADEPLDSALELYVIDAGGKRLDAIISHKGTYFEGFIPFHDVAPGIARVFARTRDEVFNLSNTAEKTVLVYGKNQITDLDIEATETPLLTEAQLAAFDTILKEAFGITLLTKRAAGGLIEVVVPSIELLRKVLGTETRSDIMTYQFGNTVKLEAFFKDFDGNPVDPSNIKLIVYDSKFNMLTSVPISSANRIELGHYEYLYKLPSGTTPKTIYYEWYAEISGSPTVKREEMKLVFV